MQKNFAIATLALCLFQQSQCNTTIDSTEKKPTNSSEQLYCTQYIGQGEVDYIQKTIDDIDNSYSSPLMLFAFTTVSFVATNAIAMYAQTEKDTLNKINIAFAGMFVGTGAGAVANSCFNNRAKMELIANHVELSKIKIQQSSRLDPAHMFIIKNQSDKK